MKKKLCLCVLFMFSFSAFSWEGEEDDFELSIGYYAWKKTSKSVVDTITCPQGLWGNGIADSLNKRTNLDWSWEQYAAFNVEAFKLDSSALNFSEPVAGWKFCFPSVEVDSTEILVDSLDGFHRSAYFKITDDLDTAKVDSATFVLLLAEKQSQNDPINIPWMRIMFALLMLAVLALVGFGLHYLIQFLRSLSFAFKKSVTDLSLGYLEITNLNRGEYVGVLKLLEKINPDTDFSTVFSLSIEDSALDLYGFLQVRLQELIKIFNRGYGVVNSNFCFVDYGDNAKLICPGSNGKDRVKRVSYPYAIPAVVLSLRDTNGTITQQVTSLLTGGTIYAGSVNDPLFKNANFFQIFATGEWDIYDLFAPDQIVQIKETANFPTYNESTGMINFTEEISIRSIPQSISRVTAAQM